MADLGQNHHFFPAIIIPSKVNITFRENNKKYTGKPQSDTISSVDN